MIPVDSSIRFLEKLDRCLLLKNGIQQMKETKPWGTLSQPSRQLSCLSIRDLTRLMCKSPSSLLVLRLILSPLPACGGLGPGLASILVDLA